MRILPEDASAALPCFWPEHELEAFQDEALIIELEGFKTEMYFYCELFQKIMGEHPHIFPEEYRDPDLFMSMFSNVISRCFGTGLDSTSLVPVGDNFNHSAIGSTLEVLNKSLQRKGAAAPQYFTIERYLCDFSLAFQKPDQEKQEGEDVDLETNLVEGLSAEERLNVMGRYNRKLYQHDLQALSAANIRLNLQGGKHIWQVPFFEDVHDEDNDTESEEESEEDSEEEETTEKKEKAENKMKERHGFEQIIR